MTRFLLILICNVREKSIQFWQNWCFTLAPFLNSLVWIESSNIGPALPACGDWLIDWLIDYCSAYHSRIFHSSKDITVIDKRLQNFTPSPFEQGGIFIVPYLLQHGTLTQSHPKDRPTSRVLRKACVLSTHLSPDHHELPCMYGIFGFYSLLGKLKLLLLNCPKIVIILRKVFL